MHIEDDLLLQEITRVALEIVGWVSRAELQSGARVGRDRSIAPQ